MILGTHRRMALRVSRARREAERARRINRLAVIMAPIRSGKPGLLARTGSFAKTISNKGEAVEKMKQVRHAILRDFLRREGFME